MSPPNFSPCSIPLGFKSCFCKSLEFHGCPVTDEWGLHISFRLPSNTIAHQSISMRFCGCLYHTITKFYDHTFLSNRILFRYNSIHLPIVCAMFLTVFYFSTILYFMCRRLIVISVLLS